MFDAILESLPPGWREPLTALLGIVAWIPAWQERMLTLAWSPAASPTAAMLTRVLALLPLLLLVVAMWTTMLSVYTLPFRSGRGAYLRVLTLTWWDGARSVWLFWAGLARLGLVLLGWIWGTLRLAASLVGRMLRGIIASPMAALDWTTRKYFKPGVPWLAFLLILGWSALEATIFTFTLRPTLTGVLWDLTGTQPNPAVLSPILFLFLFLLIAGSFACVYVLTEAIERRNIKEIVQMLMVEFFVMFFEVVFLYRDLIDAITPWIAQQTNDEVRLGLWSTLALASFGWVGIRGMTWFLFGRFGTPALLAILSRDTLEEMDAETETAPRPAGSAGAEVSWTAILQTFKNERAWFEEQGKILVEHTVLPVLQLLAAAVNFCLVVVTSRPAFPLPFDSLDEAMARLPAGAAEAEVPVGARTALDAGEA